MSAKKSRGLFRNSSFYLRFVYTFGSDQRSENHQPKLQPRMRKVLLLLVCTSFSFLAFSQTPDSPKFDSTGKWKVGGLVSISFGQGGSKNWAAGSEKWSVQLGTIVNVYANRHMGKWDWTNNLDLGYAFINTASGGYKKTDDKIYFTSKFGRKLKKNLNLSILA